MTYKQWISYSTEKLRILLDNNEDAANSYAHHLLNHICNKKIMPF